MVQLQDQVELEVEEQVRQVDQEQELLEELMQVVVEEVDEVGRVRYVRIGAVKVASSHAPGCRGAPLGASLEHSILRRGGGEGDTGGRGGDGGGGYERAEVAVSSLRDGRGPGASHSPRGR